MERKSKLRSARRMGLLALVAITSGWALSDSAGGRNLPTPTISSCWTVIQTDVGWPSFNTGADVESVSIYIRTGGPANNNWSWYASIDVEPSEFVSGAYHEQTHYYGPSGTWVDFLIYPWSGDGETGTQGYGCYGGQGGFEYM